MSEGHGFESQHCKLDGHFVTFICDFKQKQKHPLKLSIVF